MMHTGTRVVFPRQHVAELERWTVDDDDLGPEDVVVRTHVTVVSPGTELAWLSGRSLTDGGRAPRYPRGDIGYANVGTVLAAGPNAGVAKGQRVYTMGPHASVARVGLVESVCVPVPAEVPDEVAAFARFATVSMTTLRTTRARAGDEVTVVGLGLVGNLAAQVFRATGMVVHAVDRSPARREFATRCGLDRVYGVDDLEPLLRGSRLVIEATGSPEALATCVRLAATGGEVAMVGAPWVDANASVPSHRLTGEIFTRFLNLRSGFEWELPIHPRPSILGSLQENGVAAMRWLAEGRMRVDPLITHRWSPERIQEAYAGLRDNPDEFVGVVLDWASYDAAHTSATDRGDR